MSLTLIKNKSDYTVTNHLSFVILIYPRRLVILSTCGGVILLSRGFLWI